MFLQKEGVESERNGRKEGGGMGQWDEAQERWEERCCTRSERNRFSGVQAGIPDIPQPHTKKGSAPNRFLQATCAGREPGFSAAFSFFSCHVQLFEASQSKKTVTETNEMRREVLWKKT